jgi:zinc transporter ZupT
MVLNATNAPIVAGYGMIPSLCMFIASVVASFVAVPSAKIVFALQHLAGGIILSAIAIEFVPVLIKDNKSPWEIPVVIISFLAGAGFLILVEGFIDKAENSGDHEEKANSRDIEMKKDQLKSSLLNYENVDKRVSASENRVSKSVRKSVRKSIVTRAFENVALTDEQKSGLKPILKSTVLLQEKDMVDVVKAIRYPVTLAFAVALDAFLDGTFIGISYAAADASGNEYGGLVLALSLSIEMTFLGLSFSVAIPSNCSFTLKLLSFAMGPIILLGGTFFGAGAGLALEEYPLAFQAVTAFGASALLFTVGEELLVAAHEENDEHEWWIDLTTICGFLVTIVIDKLTNYFL